MSGELQSLADFVIKTQQDIAELRRVCVTNHDRIGVLEDEARTSNDQKIQKLWDDIPDGKPLGEMPGIPPAPEVNVAGYEDLIKTASDIQTCECSYLNNDTCILPAGHYGRHEKASGYRWACANHPNAEMPRPEPNAYGVPPAPVVNVAGVEDLIGTASDGGYARCVGGPLNGQMLTPVRDRVETFEDPSGHYRLLREHLYGYPGAVYEWVSNEKSQSDAEQSPLPEWLPEDAADQLCALRDYDGVGQISGVEVDQIFDLITRWFNEHPRGKAAVDRADAVLTRCRELGIYDPDAAAGTIKTLTAERDKWKARANDAFRLRIRWMEQAAEFEAERDKAFRDRDTAEAERGHALRDREHAMSNMLEASKDRDRYLAERDEAIQERDEIGKAHAKCHRQRDAAMKDLSLAVKRAEVAEAKVARVEALLRDANMEALWPRSISIALRGGGE